MVNSRRRDLRLIHDYIAKDSKYYAKKAIQTIMEKTEKLDDFPEIGRVVPEIDDPNIRELFVYSYRLIYEISPEGLEILAIVHVKKDFLSGILHDPER
ncbi:type II toxin-antitoxin system RelE/ParE family toxin [Thermodesulfobacteriota bacterium]